MGECGAHRNNCCGKSKFAAAFLRHKGKGVFKMKKRGLSILLCALMLLSTLHFTVYADVNEITAYITISKYGDIVEGKDGNPVAEAMACGCPVGGTSPRCR